MNLQLKQKVSGFALLSARTGVFAPLGGIVENRGAVFENPAHSPDITVIRRFRQRGPVLRTIVICVLKIAVSRTQKIFFKCEIRSLGGALPSPAFAFYRMHSYAVQMEPNRVVEFYSR